MAISNVFFVAFEAQKNLPLSDGKNKSFFVLALTSAAPLQASLTRERTRRARMGIRIRTHARGEVNHTTAA